MRAPARLALFALLLAVVFGGAALIGGAVDPETSTAGGGHAEESEGAHGGEDAAASLPGLAVEQEGMRLVLERTTAPAGRRPLAFRILDEDGEPVREFEVEHTKRLHLIVVRRDLTGFQHLHPDMAPDGTWSTEVDLPAGGTYRVFADFTIDGEQHTLGADLHVPGTFRPRAVPAPTTTVADDRGLQVRRRAGADGAVAFDVLRDGEVINDELEDFLGAKGHLVTLRAGDLAYLHTHPDGDRLSFGVELPTPGTYRSWVQFQIDGRIHTAALTEEKTR